MDSKYFKFDMGPKQDEIIKRWIKKIGDDQPEIKRTIKTCYQNNTWPKVIDLENLKVNFFECVILMLITSMHFKYQIVLKVEVFFPILQIAM